MASSKHQEAFEAMRAKVSAALSEYQQEVGQFNTEWLLLYRGVDQKDGTPTTGWAAVDNLDRINVLGQLRFMEQAFLADAFQTWHEHKEENGE